MEVIYGSRGREDSCLLEVVKSIFEKVMSNVCMPTGKRRSDLPSGFPDKRPPDEDAEYKPCRDGCRICFPIRFAGCQAMFVDLPDREFTRRTDVHIQGHILHAFRAFFGNIPVRTSGIVRGVWCFHANPIFTFLMLDNA